MRKNDYQPLGKYIEQVNVRNRDLTVTNLMGVSIEKRFIPSIANTIGTDLSPYKIVKPGQFAYGPVTSRNGDKITIALYNGNEDCIISQAYEAFRIKDTTQLLPEYLMMWAKRPEFDRYARYMSHGSVRELFSWEEMCNVMLPVPPIEEQRRIVSEYQTVERRIANNEALIQKLEETAQAIYHHTFVEGIDEENLPEGWRKGKLGEIVLFKVGGDRPAVYSETLTNDCTVPIYSNGINKKGLYGYTNKAVVTDDSFTISARGNVGTCFLRRKPYCGIVRLISVIPCKSNLLYYLYFYLSSMNLQGDGSAQSQITVPQLEDEDVIIPNSTTLTKFQDEMTVVTNYIEDTECENSHLCTLLSLLTSKLS